MNDKLDDSGLNNWQLEKWIDEKNKHQEDSKETNHSFQSRKRIWDDIPIENKPSNLSSDSDLGSSQYPQVNLRSSKPSSPDKPRNATLFWFIAILLAIYFLSHQGSNKKQQPKQQDYPKDVPALSSE